MQMDNGTITVNNLPAPTWEKLKVNRAAVSVCTDYKEASMICKAGDEPAVTDDAGTIKSFSGIKTGMGDEVSSLLDRLGSEGKISPKLLSASGKTHLKIEGAGTQDLAGRLLIDVPEGKKATVIMDISGAAGVLQTLVRSGKDSDLELIQVIRSSGNKDLLNDIGSEGSEGSVFKLVQVFMPGKSIYAGCKALLSGRGSRYEAYIGYDLDGSDVLDMNYHAVHTGKDTESMMNASGALSGSSEKTFRGTIDFIRGAKRAVGNEAEDVLILDEGVINKTVPLILCEEEDVEGNHGASIGMPDEETLFYIMSRGIDREEALAVLRRSKVSNAVMNMSDEEYRNEIMGLIYDRD